MPAVDLDCQRWGRISKANLQERKDFAATRKLWGQGLQLIKRGIGSEGVGGGSLPCPDSAWCETLNHSAQTIVERLWGDLYRGH